MPFAYHPYLAKEQAPCDRLVIAYYWQVMDANFKNAFAWDLQVQQAEADLKEFFAGWGDLQEAQFLSWRGFALRQAYEKTNHRSRVRLGDFSSGSAVIPGLSATDGTNCEKSY